MYRLNALFHAFAAALILALALFVVPEARAQIISNTAQATWDEGGQAHSAISNTVQFSVTQSPLTIEALRPVAGPQTYPGLPVALCGGRPLPLGGGTGGAGLGTLSPTQAISIGENLYLRISAPSSNTDPDTVNSLVVDLIGSSGDREQITIFETDANSGIFVGGIPTTESPPAPIPNNCRLSVRANDIVTARFSGAGGQGAVQVAISILADPYGLIFDSADGAPVDGAIVSLVDDATGAPAIVYADDGITTWPSTVISGQPITDGNGVVHAMATGEYRFPLAPLGTYRLVVTPPSPYTAPSVATPAQLAGLLRPDGNPMQILPASYGQTLALTSPAPVRVDIPIDRPSLAVTLTKTASRQVAVPGDAILYTIVVANTDPTRIRRAVVINDIPSSWLRLRLNSVRIDGQVPNGGVTLAPDGRTVTIALGDLAGGASRTITYAASVRADAPAAQALNRAEATDALGNRAVASAAVRIERDIIAGRMTLIGRITDGGCSVDGLHRGIPGVRVMLEDGSFAVTDTDGRYHFEGLMPGTHVVQAATQTLPAGGQFADCARSTRSAGSASSRFVFGQGGSLLVADFSANLPSGPLSMDANAPEVAAPSDREAAGGETNWLALSDGPTDFLFPSADHNPRAPAVRVVIRHRKGQTVALSVDGKPVEKLAFDGTQSSPTGFAVSVWRGIPLNRETSRLTATVQNADGSISAQLSRDVHFAATPARFELVPERSRLVADGKTRPVVAVRIVDRFGRPVHAGLTGAFAINAPYESAAQLDALQARQLSGLDRAAPTWTVKGDDGIARIELAPTMVSGALRMDFSFADGPVTRRQTLETWVVPGDQKWTLVGLAEGTVGARSVADNMERGGTFDSDLGNDARVAFYAKGRVLGRYLLTLAYDSAKQKDEQRLLGTIDPKAYYTVFADGSERRFDAASREKLYVRIEGRSFYALYGDFMTDFDKTVLASYRRNLTGVKGEAVLRSVRLQGFAARSGALHKRDEFQGAGISGPYRLTSRDMVANSETVTIEVRDRFRSEVIVEKRVLERFVDYEIDLLSGTIRFREPILSRDTLLNPRFIVVEYDVARASDGAVNAGVRSEFASNDQAIRIGSTFISDASGPSGERANLAALDLRARIGNGTELRAEAAISRTGGNNDHGWLVEVEHHDGNLDMLGYVRSVSEGFGLGRISGAEQGRRKVGLDARYRFSDALALNASAWHDDSLVDNARRDAIEVAGTYRTEKTEARLGMSSFIDRLHDGTKASSVVAEGAVTQRFFDNRLEVTGAASIALGTSESIDLPSRYQLGLRYAVTPAIKLTADYEIAQGDAIRARTARAGVEVSPWDGARIVTSLGQQDIAENGKRSFAAFGLSQSLPVTHNLTLDATLDSARTLGGVDPARLVNPAHPAASGGLVGSSGSIAEDFTAITLGATWRQDLWVATVRGEGRNGDQGDRRGATFGLIRQLGEGSAIGTGFTWTQAKAIGGSRSEIFEAAVSAAYRPAHSPFSALTKLEYRSDAVAGAVAGEVAPDGRTALTVTGNAAARRLIGSISANWSPRGAVDGQQVQRSEVGLFAAIRHTFDQYEGFDLKGTSLIGGADLRFGIGPRFEIGGLATVRHSLTEGTTTFSVGPQIGFVPVDNVLLTVGYNLTGFRDRDFGASRTTAKGLFAAVRVKLDTDLLGSLGLRQ